MNEIEFCQKSVFLSYPTSYWVMLPTVEQKQNHVIRTLNTIFKNILSRFIIADVRNKRTVKPIFKPSYSLTSRPRKKRQL